MDVTHRNVFSSTSRMLLVREIEQRLKIFFNWHLADKIAHFSYLNNEINQYTGWLLETVKNYLLTNRATKQPVSWHRCLFVHQICTFWYLVSKDFDNYSVIKHLWRLWRCKTVEICKIHWKLMIFKSQYCFANISATEAPMFMKFETYIHETVKI